MDFHLVLWHPGHKHTSSLTYSAHSVEAVLPYRSAQEDHLFHVEEKKHMFIVG